MEINELQCERGLCRQKAKWVPKLLVIAGPEHGNTKPEQIFMSVVLCDRCRMQTVPGEFLSLQQRRQIEGVFATNDRPAPDWSTARFDWIDVHSSEVKTQVLACMGRQATERN